MRYRIATLVLLSGFALGQEALSLKARIPLPNVDGRIDHFTVDVKGQRLFVSALGNHTVEVLDLEKNKRVHTLTDLAEPQGLFYDPSTNRLFVACHLDGATKIYDGTTFKLVQTVKFSADADNIRHDARSGRVIVGYGGDKGATGQQGRGVLAFLDTNVKQAAEIAVDAHPESFQLEKNGTRVFVNVPVKQEIQVADLARNATIGRWPTAPAASCFPMGLDETHSRLFSGCRAPARLLVFDMAAGKIVASPEIVGDTDDLFYDAARRRIYVIGGQGFIDVLQQEDADHYKQVAQFPTPAGTRTGLFVPDWGKLFAAVPHRGEQGAEILVFEAK